MKWFDASIKKPKTTNMVIAILRYVTDESTHADIPVIAYYNDDYDGGWVLVTFDGMACRLNMLKEQEGFEKSEIVKWAKIK
jgi:hypothetical protein